MTNVKTCTKCNETKATTDFSKHIRRKDGLQNHCKVCYSNSRVSMTVAERCAFDAVLNTRRRSDLSSVDLYGGLTSTQACLMTLPFAKERLRLEAETGVAHHIDHLIPLAAGGTHTRENLQVLTASENIAKGAT